MSDSPLALDPTIHAPIRLAVMTALSGVEGADFTYLLGITGATDGNLATHLRRLEEAGYVNIRKSFRRRRPHTRYRLTPKGRDAFAAIWNASEPCCRGMFPSRNKPKSGDRNSDDELPVRRPPVIPRSLLCP